VERAVEEAESRVSEWEGRVSAIRAQLEDPALYAAPEGATRARELGRDLEAARASLERALEDWESASTEKAKALAADEGR
jgi:uncharacterized protein involved in exopolysaccharide biosynthesis